MRSIVSRLIATATVPLASTLFAFACLADPSLPQAALEDDWYEARTEHFTVFSNLGGGDAAEVGRRLERLCEVLASTNPTLSATSPRPTHVYAFRGESSFKRYRPANTENMAGFFTTAEDRNLIAFNAHPEHADGTDVLYHEYIHCWLRHNVPRLPLWLNEGLAMYYSTFRAGDQWAEIGGAVPAFPGWMREHLMMPLDQLFAIREDSPDYRRGDDRTTFYVQSWGLTHYLLQRSPESAVAFGRFLARLQRGNPAEQAFDECVPRERRKELLAGLVEYGRRDQFQLQRYTFAARFAKVRTEPRRMARAEVLYRLGELAVQLGSEGEPLAKAHFRAAAGLDTLHAGAIASLGALADGRGETAVAESLYLAAGTIAPESAVPYVIAGRGALERYVTGHRYSVAVESRTPSALRVARQRFLRSLELDPDHLEALIGYGQTFCTDSTPPRAAVSALRSASALLPARIDVAWHLTLLLARAGRFAEADSVFGEKIGPLQDPLVERTLKQELFRCRVEAGVRMAEQGDPVGAEALIATARQGTRDRELLEIADAQLARVRREASRKPSGSRPAASTRGTFQPIPGTHPAYLQFTKALEAAKQNRYDEAIAILDARDSTWGILLEEADGLARKLRARRQLSRAIGLINAGDLDQARTLLAGIETRGLDDSTRAHLERLRRRTEARIAIQGGFEQARRGRLASASSRIDSVLASRVDDDLRDYARTLGQEVDARITVQRGIDLMKAGKLHEARSHFQGLLQSPMSTPMRGYVNGLIAHVSGRIDVDRALELIRTGDREEARRLLAAVVQKPIGTSLKRYAESILKQLDSPTAP